jgi:hypothetical protein
MVPDRWTARRPCSTPGASASHCNRANTKSGPVVNAVRRRSRHDPGSRAEVSRSGVRHMDSAKEIVAWAVPNPHRPDSTCEGLPVGAIIVAHQNRSAPCSTGRPPRSVVRVTPRSDAGSPQTRAAVDVRERRRARCTPEGDVELVTKKEVLDFQLPQRFEQIGDEHRKQLEYGKHRLGCCPDSSSAMVTKKEVLDFQLQARAPADGIFGNDRSPRREFVGGRLPQRIVAVGSKNWSGRGNRSSPGQRGRAVCRDRTDAAAHRVPPLFCSWLLRITLAKTGAA